MRWQVFDRCAHVSFLAICVGLNLLYLRNAILVVPFSVSLPTPQSPQSLTDFQLYKHRNNSKCTH